MMDASNDSKINNKKKCIILMTLGSFTSCLYIFYNVLGEKNTVQFNTDLIDVKNCYTEVREELDIFSVVNSTFKTIYFVHVSCQEDLTIRQLCSVESAARTNPSWIIYVLLVGSVKVKGRWEELEKYHNVKTIKIDIIKYAAGSPVDSTFLQDIIHAANGPEHLSTVLKLITLYKYGGIAAELDMIFARPFDALEVNNWFAKERSDVLGTGIFALTEEVIRKNISEAILRQLRQRFYEGKSVIQEIFKTILLDLCQVAEFNELSGITCDGFEIFDSDYFYPLHEEQSNAYYTSGTLNNQYAFVYHTWHKTTKNLKIDKDSPYVKLAIKYCPNTYIVHSNMFINKTDT